MLNPEPSVLLGPDVLPSHDGHVRIRPERALVVEEHLGRNVRRESAQEVKDLETSAALARRGRPARARQLAGAPARQGNVRLREQRPAADAGVRDHLPHVPPDGVMHPEERVYVRTHVHEQNKPHPEDQGEQQRRETVAPPLAPIQILEHLKPRDRGRRRLPRRERQPRARLRCGAQHQGLPRTSTRGGRCRSSADWVARGQWLPRGHQHRPVGRHDAVGR
mmetsp:Transcript_31156/g.98007  ORF Transcript_31156/g.98007 Transcript_31156/m.98007 type:complete len:221 (+) Transcript_31156:2064-2726(+)